MSCVGTVRIKRLVTAHLFRDTNQARVEHGPRYAYDKHLAGRTLSLFWLFGRGYVGVSISLRRRIPMRRELRTLSGMAEELAGLIEQYKACS